MCEGIVSDNKWEEELSIGFSILTTITRTTYSSKLPLARRTKLTFVSGATARKIWIPVTRPSGVAARVPDATADCSASAPAIPVSQLVVEAHRSYVRGESVRSEHTYCVGIERGKKIRYCLGVNRFHTEAVSKILDGHSSSRRGSLCRTA